MNADEEMNVPIKIDEQFKNVLPPLNADDYKKLEENCRKHGIQDPLKTWNGLLIDGHNRYKISEDWDLNYTVKDMTDELKTRADVIKWMIDNQEGRRNMTKTDLVLAYAEYEKELAKEAAEKLHPGRPKKSEEKIEANLPQINSNKKRNPQVRAQVAKKIGVGERTYDDLKVVATKGTQEQKDRVDKKTRVFDKETNSYKSNGASEIKAEILRDKKIVEEHGSDEQKERLKKGGKGNEPSAIADEMREEGKVPKVQTKKCSMCGEMLPVSFFTDGRSICKSCKASKASIKPYRDVSGKPIASTGKFDNVTEKEIIGNIYSDKKTEYSISELVTGFEINFKSCMTTMRGILDQHIDLVKGNHVAVEKMFDNATNEFKKMKEEYV